MERCGLRTESWGTPMMFIGDELRGRKLPERVVSSKPRAERG